MRITLQSLIKTAAFVPLAFATAMAQDFDSVEMKVHPVSGNVSYIEGMGGNIGHLPVTTAFF